MIRTRALESTPERLARECDYNLKSTLQALEEFFKGRVGTGMNKKGRARFRKEAIEECQKREVKNRTTASIIVKGPQSTPEKGTVILEVLGTQRGATYQTPNSLVTKETHLRREGLREWEQALAVVSLIILLTLLLHATNLVEKSDL